MKRCAIALAAFLAASASVHSQGLSSVETEDLRLLYFDPTETYLVPHLVRSFHGALDGQKNILDYSPGEKTTVLLVDFSD